MWSSLTLILAAAAFGQSANAAAAPAFTESMLQEAYARVAPAICVLSYSFEVTNPNTGNRTKQDASSVGLLVSPNGLIIARGHMSLENVEPFNIRAVVGHGPGSHDYPVELLRKPSDVNVAFLRIQSDGPLDLPHLRFATPSRLELGAPVAVFGLLGQTLDHNPAFVIRRVGSVLTTPRTTYCIDDPVASGYVGGPVVNARGEVVGVVGYDLTYGEGGDLYVRSGHPLIYQSELLVKHIQNPPGPESPDAPEAWLGVFTQPLSDDFAEYWGLPNEGGAVVSTIVPGSPAAAAGLQRGDVIVRFNDQPVRPKHDREIFAFTKLIRETTIGETVKMEVLRDGQPVVLDVTLAAQPTAARDALEFEDKIFGLTVRELTTDVRILLSLPEDVQGVIVRRVESGSWAALASIRPGTIILAIDGRPIGGIEDFKQAVERVAEEKPREVAIFARVGPVTGFYRLEPRWADETP